MRTPIDTKYWQRIGVTEYRPLKVPQLFNILSSLNQNNMKNIKRLLSPAECLLRVFSPFYAISHPLKHHHLSPRRGYINQRLIAGINTSPVERDRLAEFTKDEAIDTPTVQVKQSDGTLSESQSLQKLLRQIDRRNQLVVQLSKPGERSSAVVQIYEKLDLLKQLREREIQAKKQAQAHREKKPKQIELNWAISDHDLELKLKQMEMFLEKGKKVEILLASKRKQRKATMVEGEQVLKTLRSKIQDIGANEIKAMEGQLLKQATITVKKGS